MTPPFRRWLKAFIGIICLVMVALGTSSDEGTCVYHAGGSLKTIQIGGTFPNTGCQEGLALSSLNFSFGNWIPEAIRAVTIRLVNFTTYRSDFFLNILSGVVLIDLPIYILKDFKRAPDFVGFLFRLKPF